MVKVKICGVTRVEDAVFAAEAGADAIGLNFVEGYARCITPDLAREITRHLPPYLTVVGIFAGREVAEIRETVWTCGLNVVQLHGDEPPEDCLALAEDEDQPLQVIKAFRVRGRETLERISDYRRNQWITPLLDAYHPQEIGGVGKTFEWELISNFECRENEACLRPFILSGGLNADNVGRAVRTLKPYAVDVSSGVESELCQKDPEKVRAYILNAKSADPD